MEIKSEKNSMNNKGAIFNNDGDVFNGNKNETYVFYNSYVYVNDKVYEDLTNSKSENYAEFYKKYIARFKELEDYALYLFYPKLINKSFDFTSETLVFGKKIIEWIYGLSDFPYKEIKLFYKELKDDYDFEEDSIIVQRWNCNIPYFDGNLKSSTEKYDILYNVLIEKNNIPVWYIDDVCIDGRNILLQYGKTINKYQYDNKFQRSINKNKHKLSYPDIDRIQSEIFSNMLKHLFNNKNKSKNTIVFGIGLEECFKQIQNLIYLTIFYGSITHLRTVRKLIANIMYMYADTFDDERFYELALKMLFLSGEIKKYKKLYNKIKLIHTFVNEDYFIKKLIDSRKSLFSFEKNAGNIFLFDIYGRYINDELYIELEKNILNLLKINDTYQINLISNAFSAISTNIMRFKNISELIIIIKEYLEKAYMRFFNDFNIILNEINVEGLSNDDFINFQIIVDLLIKNKNYINFDFSNCIIKIKQRDKTISKYDDLLKSQEKTADILYQLKIEKNELEAIRIIIHEYKKRHEEREKNPGIFYDYGADYNIGTKIFHPEEYKGENRRLILDEYVPLAKCIISSENEIIYEKIKHIKLLAYLLMVETDKKVTSNIFSLLHRTLNIPTPNESFNFENFKSRNINDLLINVIMCDVIMSKSDYNDILNKYLEILINCQENTEEVLKCTKILNKFVKNKNDNVIDKLYILFNLCFKINDIDIRNLTITMSKVFNNTQYQDVILNKLEERAKTLTFEECKGYINLINDADTKDLYNNIVILLKNSKNYYIKYMAEKYLQ